MAGGGVVSRPILVTRRPGERHVIRGLHGDLNPAPDTATVDRIVAHYDLAVDWETPTVHGDGRTSWPIIAAEAAT